MKTKLTALAAVICAAFHLNAAPTITIHTAQPGGKINPAMWGIFFEDINMAADGGVYAELVKNRSFEFKMPLMGWREVKQEGANGSILILFLTCI